MFSEEDSLSLSLWQRAVFRARPGGGEGGEPSSSGGAAAAADSLRTRLARLEFEHYKA